MKRKFTRVRKDSAKHGYKMKCKLCGHIWFPKLKTPMFCPRCNGRL